MLRRSLATACVAAALLTLAGPHTSWAVPPDTPPAGARPASAPERALASAALPAAERELTADQQVLHALNRLGFGPRPGDAERVRAMGVDRWIAQQLAAERLADPAGDALARRYPLLALSPAELVREVPPPQLLRRALQRRGNGGLSREDSAALRRELMASVRASQRILGELQSMRVARAVVSERQLQEVMVDFWENHFTVFAGKGPFARHYLVHYDRDVIRPHALGRFRDLLGAVAKSPAMLTYLDNAQSQANADAPTLRNDRRARAELARSPRALEAAARRRGISPDSLRSLVSRREAQQRQRGLNENYARELLELHTLGVDGGYTQQDVIEVARALTGWTVQPPAAGGGAFVFRPQWHDAGAKTVLGARLPAGRGIEDGEQVLDILARHPATARHVATRLARRLVSDEPPTAVVERAAATFQRTDGDLREVVRTIVTSPEFFSRAAYRSKVKSPFELVVSALRAVGAEPDTTPRTAQVVAYLGQPLFGHQAPNGWPETGEAWINTGAILGRINFGLALAGGALPTARPAAWPPARELATASREQQVDAVTAALLGGELSPDTRQVLRSGENPLLARDSSAANGAGGASALAGAGSERLDEMPGGGMRRGARALTPRRPPEGLALVLGLAIGSPEFQRR